MRDRYVVLVALIGAVWWMHRRTSEVEAVAAPAPAPIHTTAPRTFTAPTPRPELPPPAPALPDDGHVLRGHVASPDGVDLGGAHVIAVFPGRDSRGAVTDADGTFHIDGLASGDYDVIYFYGSAGTTGTVTVGPGDSTWISATVDPTVAAPARILEWQEVEVVGLPSPYRERPEIDYESIY
jgi:hypothetical protein